MIIHRFVYSTRSENLMIHNSLLLDMVQLLVTFLYRIFYAKNGMTVKACVRQE